jgi:hypothetical protein
VSGVADSPGTGGVYAYCLITARKLSSGVTTDTGRGAPYPASDKTAPWRSSWRG